jgi:hypothetical protein
MSDQGNVLPPAVPTTSAPAAPIPDRHTVFRGPNGIRAGWRVLIFFGIFAGLAGVINLVVFLVMHFLGRGRAGFQVSSLTPAAAVLSDGGILVLTATAAFIMSRIEHRKWGEYGLPAASAFGRNFWIGLLSGFAAISCTLLAIFSLHGFHLTGLAIHGSTILLATAAWSAAFVVVGLGEEFAFRGYLQFTLTTGMGFWPAAIALSALFALAHVANPGESVPGLLSVVCFGLVFCFIVRRTGNIWWVVGFHAGWDWGQTFFYGVTDSGLVPYHNLFNSTFSGPRWLTGGSVGPEASIFTPIALLLTAFIVSRFHREIRYHPAGEKT